MSALAGGWWLALRYQSRIIFLPSYAIGIPVIALVCAMPGMSAAARGALCINVALLAMVMPMVMSAGLTTQLRILPIWPGVMPLARWLLILAIAELGMLPTIVSALKALAGFTELSSDPSLAIRCSLVLPFASAILLIVFDLLCCWPIPVAIALGAVLMATVFCAEPLVSMLPSVSWAMLCPLLGALGLILGGAWSAVVAPRLQLPSFFGGFNRMAEDARPGGPLHRRAWHASTAASAQEPPRLISVRARLVLLSLFSPTDLALVPLVFCVIFAGSNLVLYSMAGIGAVSGFIDVIRRRRLDGRLPVHLAFITALLTGPLLVLVVGWICVFARPLPGYDSLRRLDANPAAYLSTVFPLVHQFRLPDGTVLSDQAYQRRLAADSAPDTAFLHQQLAVITADELQVAPSQVQTRVERRPMDHSVTVAERSQLRSRYQTSQFLIVALWGVVIAVTLELFVIASGSRPSTRSHLLIYPGLALMAAFPILGLAQMLLAPSIVNVPAQGWPPALRAWWGPGFEQLVEHRVLVYAGCVLVVALVIWDMWRRVPRLPLAVGVRR